MTTEPTVQVPVSLVQQTVLALRQGTPQSTRRARGEALHTLLAQPTPSAEPGVSTCYDTTPHLPHRWDRGIGDEPDITWVPLRCDGAPTAPPSIADMAPGTTSWKGGDTWTVRNGGVVEDDDGQTWPASRIDPSTIRDVTPPA